MTDLTDIDKRHIEYILGRENLTWGQQCHAAYRAGLSAGRARAIEECAGVCMEQDIPHV
jgi:hypothetical protein